MSRCLFAAKQEGADLIIYLKLHSFTCPPIEHARSLTVTLMTGGQGLLVVFNLLNHLVMVLVSGSDVVFGAVPVLLGLFQAVHALKDNSGGVGLLGEPVELLFGLDEFWLVRMHYF